MIYRPNDKEPREEDAGRGRSSAKIDRVEIKGDNASIDWSATVGGKKTSITQSARRIDEEWKLVDVTN